MTDRTHEFRTLCQNQIPVVAQPVKVRKQKPALSALQQQVQFNASASDVSKEVNKVSQRLQQLTLLVRQTNMFNDPTSQINELTQLVKQDITLIHTKLDDLEMFQRSHHADYSSQHAAKHSDAIVTQMKSTLMSTTKGFKDILQVRQDNLQHQHDRKSQYGRATPSVPLAFSAPLPRPVGVEGEGGGSEHVPLISAQSQQQFVVPEQGYADSRAEAVSNIQSHIVELGELFQRLSVMISAQGDSVRMYDRCMHAPMTWHAHRLCIYLLTCRDL
ncbi:hypothetical protein, variant 1 [Aphanomyces astaci]|uniref:t-SNARE coiled-coil homology domain-containing protein n=1 Tax=Aphanomyces astaci TaxID=112090 RepID=W4GCI7_APHAT|nr:hypothetical protein, variant 1 [Aphanomyces astaci]ETV76648.1 hypothetical protein, variant 1 [Aphanomyces astaci]|eukprot:XP_009833559.1 hypothetical protein, variant 1 [Aphanomyces astaci]